MDWTGGSRRRYVAPRADPVLQKQKAHFARARASLQPIAASRYSLIPGSPQERSCHDERRRHDVPDMAVRRRVIGRHEASQQMLHSYSEAQRDTTGHARSRTMAHAIPYQTRSTNSVPRSSPKAAVVNSEEMLLLANRRKLLARSDWLNLAPTRPLQMHLPAASDQDQIGRRRKMRKSSTRIAKPARLRLLTPIFENHLELRTKPASGNLPPVADGDHLQIKIGTDAFASQSVHSRQQGTSRNQIFRPPSTDLGSLSEESMLLGEDGDTFDTNQVNVPKAALSHQVVIQRDIDSMYAYPGSQLSPLLDDSANESALSETSSSNGGSHFQRRGDFVLNTSGAGPGTDVYPTSSGSETTDTDERRLERGLETLDHILVQYQQMPGIPTTYDLQPVVEEPDPELSELPARLRYVAAPEAFPTEAVEEAEHEAWRQWIGIPPDHMAKASQAALHSASEHVTTSEGISKPALQRLEIDCAHSVQSFSTLRGSGTHMSGEASSKSNEMEHQMNDHSPADVHPPSISLAQIRELAQQNSLETNQTGKDDEADDNAVWNQFIIGSQSSETSVSYPEQVTVECHESDNSSQRQPSPDISGLDTSDHATQGLSLFVTDDAAPHYDTPPNHHTSARAASAAHSRASLSESTAQENGSLEVENDSIEDSATAQASSHKNIHAPDLVSLNPKRFKKTNKIPGPATRKQPTQPKVAPRSKSIRRMSRRSIYDLVDSDGASLS